MSDTSKVLHLSPSIAAVLLARSPLHAWQQHSLGGNRRDEPSDEMRRGKLIDRLLFRTGAEVVIVDAADWRTKAAKEARDAAEDRGAIAVLKHKYDEADRAANDIRGLLFDRGINVSDAECQKRLVWESAGTACKGFVDMVFMDGDSARIFDLKITENAAPEAIKIDFRSSLQHAAYVDAVETLFPHMAGRVTMQFVYAEPDGGDLTIAEPDGTMRALAASRWRRAVALWGECVRTSKFPGYPRTVHQVEAKPWDLTGEMAAVIPEGGSPDVSF